MTASIRISENSIEPKPDIRILGLQIDTKLKWGPHIKKSFKQNDETINGID